MEWCFHFLTLALWVGKTVSQWSLLFLEKNRWYDCLARIQLPKERYLKCIVMSPILSVQGQRHGIGRAGHLLHLPSAADGAQMRYLLRLWNGISFCLGKWMLYILCLLAGASGETLVLHRDRGMPPWVHKGGLPWDPEFHINFLTLQKK